MAERFLIARNPDTESSLPYLLRIPVDGDGLVLRAKDTWPRTSKVFCYRGDDPWTDDLEIVVEADVQSCVRRGVAIDLILERRQERRSQFVFTRLKDGREAIFWQSVRTNRKARPSVRVPGRRASQLSTFTITVDNRERYPYRFANQRATTERGALPVGDYGVSHDGELVALVERKSLADLAKGAVDGGLGFQMADLAGFRRAAVVVEDRYSQVLKHEYVDGGFLADLLAQIQVRHPDVPIVFCETRPLAEEWTFRFLGASLAHHLETPLDPKAPKTWT